VSEGVIFDEVGVSLSHFGLKKAIKRVRFLL